MKILFFSINDYANVGYTFSKCLGKVGVDAHAFSIEQHDWYDHEQGELYTNFYRMKELYDACDWVVLMHSHPQFEKFPFDLKGKKVAVFHGGSIYRLYHRDLNKLFNPIIDLSIVQTGDLLGLGAKNEKWILPGIDTERIKPNWSLPKNFKKLNIAHYPNKPDIKGSEVINDTINKLKGTYDFNYVYDPQRVDWDKNLERIQNCDVYIEAVKPVLMGKTYGEWGVTCLEAAALGRIVVTHFLSQERYKKEYGEHPLFVSNDPAQLYDNLKTLLEMSPNGQITELKNKTRDWVEDKHSLESIGKRLKNIFNL